MLPYTDEQKKIKEMARKLAKERIEPLVEEIDERGEGAGEALNILVGHGLLRLALPKEYDGINANHTTLAIVIEEIAKVDAGVSMYIFTSAQSFVFILRDFANDRQKKKLYAYCQKGDKLGAFLVTEPASGSDAANISTRAVLQGDYYLINGSKTMASNGPVADCILLFARTGPGEKSEGISCFLFQKSEITGMSSGEPFDKLGFRASKTSEIYFEDGKIGKEALIGKEGEGWKVLVYGGGGMRVWGASSLALGNGGGALEYAIQYAKERVILGKPLIEHQAIQFALADMFVQLEAARTLHYRTLQMLDQGGYKSQEYQLLTSSTKCLCCDVAMKITNDAVQLLESYGVMSKYHLGRKMRDAKVNQIFDGTSEIQKMIVGKLITV